MTSYKCEWCGSSIEQWSSNKPLYIYKADNGHHHFCSAECYSEWQGKHRATAKKELQALDPATVDELRIIYARKFREWKDLLELCLYSGDEGMQELTKKREREVEQLAEMLEMKDSAEGEEMEWKGEDDRGKSNDDS